MSLSSDLISQFVKVTKDKKKVPSESTVYGTTVSRDGVMYVQLDGSDQLTPVSNTTNIPDEGERVMVLIKNHTATVTGNLTSPSARIVTDANGNQTIEGLNVDELIDEITEFEIIIADKVSTSELEVERGRIDVLISDNVTIRQRITANEGDIDTLQAGFVTVTAKLTATDASIDNLETTKLDVTVADAKFATIEELDATNVDIHNLESTYADFVIATTDDLSAIRGSISILDADKLSASEAEVLYANIDFSNIGSAAIEQFFSKSGLIENVVVGDGTVTGHLVGVTISGDLIEGNTVKAEKLVIKGTDGLYYKLNTDGMTTEAQQTDQNSLNGSIIKAKSITATKISVSDLVAFGATIGGFKITNNSIYSGAKSTATNTTRGIYMDTDGQMAFGDSDNFIKYYKDSNGLYRLEVSASSMLLGSSRKSVETSINEATTKATNAQKSIDNLEVGGRNYLVGSEVEQYTDTATRAEFLKTTFDLAPFFDQNGLIEVTLSFDIYAPVPGNVMVYCQNGSGSRYAFTKNVSVTTEWERHSVTFTPTGPDDTFTESYLAFYGTYDSGVIPHVRKLKLEKGNKATDWTLAPEDMATAVDVNEANSIAEDAQKRVAAAEALIEVLSESISMLVTDGSGASLMTQTENGWTFSTAELQAVVDRISDGIGDLTGDVDNVNNAVSILQQSVDDLGELSKYVKIGTYEDEPCIELGEGDSDFKLIITNTRIMFMEGTGVPAYINNQSLYIRKAVVEEELQQGGFVWKVRSNGNLGLVWKGEA